jgi:hypothetical protein
MNVEPSGRRRRWSGRILRVCRRHPVCAFLLFAVPIASAGLTLLLAGRSVPVAEIIAVGQVVILLLSPALLFGAALYAPRGVRAVRRLIDDRRAKRWPHPSGPPIEQIAADLRRLLWQHDTCVRSADMAVRARHLRALEAAISDCVTQAARALGVACPDRPGHGGYDKLQLRLLLRTLAAEGLVLPAAVGLLTPDGRF